MTIESRRTKALLLVSLVLWLGLFQRLACVQLVRWKHYESEAQRQHSAKLELKPSRGRIFDRYGRALALNRSCCSIRILPQYARDRDTLAAILAEFGLGGRSAIRHELRGHDRLFWFRRHVDYRLADSLRRTLGRRRFANCTLVDDDNMRVYPYGDACAKLVGFVGTERGLAAIESRFDSVLRGRSGWVQLQRDAVGQCLPYPSYPRKDPSAGADIRLTLDVDIQQICHQALRRAVLGTDALGGSVVVLSARTGEVLALTDYPSYDPARFPVFAESLYRCAAVCDQFEPGSSFKIVIGAAALESPRACEFTSRSYDVSTGFIELAGYRISDVHLNGILDFDGLFVKSSNPGCAMLSLDVDRELFYLTARAMGFGSAVGIDLPGEGSGAVDKPSRLTALRLANNSFGQGVTVTLLQLAAAYLCIANEGVYLRPYLVESVEAGDRTIRRCGRAEVRRAVSSSSARRLKAILSDVVLEGTGTAAAIPGVEVCGKTGTAQKVEPGGGYSKTRARMSFVGFFPTDSPAYVVALMVDEPRAERFASTVACPAFRDIGERILALERMRRGMAEAGANSQSPKCRVQGPESVAWGR